MFFLGFFLFVMQIEYWYYRKVTKLLCVNVILFSVLISIQSFYIFIIFSSTMYNGNWHHNFVVVVFIVAYIFYSNIIVAFD